MTDRHDHQEHHQPTSPFGETEEEFLAFLSRMTDELAPRQFALYEVLGERQDARIIAWGAAHEDRTDLNFNSGKSHGRFGPVKEFQELFGPHNGYRLVWTTQPSGPQLA